MAKKAAAAETAYGTKLKYKGMRSNHPVKSRYMAAALAMILGVVGANQFYLHNFIKGLLKILFTLIFVVVSVLFNPLFMLILVALSLISGFVYLLQSDEAFARKNHVRTI